MSDTANIELLVEKVKSIERTLADAGDKRLDAFTGLLESIESSLADMLENIEKGGGAAAIAGMTKALASLKMPESTFSPQITVQPAPERAAPVVNVQVQPTPITVEALMPQAVAPIVNFTPPVAPVSYEIRIRGAYGAPDKVMTITPIYTPAISKGN